MISTCIVENVVRPPQTPGAEQRPPVARHRQPLEQPGGEVAQQKCADDVDDECRPRPVARRGCGKRCERRASEGAQCAADEDRRKLAAVETEHEPKYRRPAFAPAYDAVLGGAESGHGCEPTCRSAGPTRRSHRCGPGGDGLLHRRTRPGQRGSAGGVRHVRAPWLQPGRGVQRSAHPGDHAGDRRVPGGAGHHRTAFHRP